MTHQNFQTNGASLEDCHTNFFALTDLCGIKWRRLSAESVFSVDPLDDPVLVSFTKCLAADILCVWRRIPHFKSSGDTTHLGQRENVLNNAKELWIFWYGDDPDLSNLVCNELLIGEPDQGSWENGLSYECRALLFKALHNLIERCFLAQNLIRIGKWFVQPYEGCEKRHGKNSHLTFSFTFFVHGESTVCVSLDVRQHPPVWRLEKHHISVAQNSITGLQVLLAPFGLSGTFTGQAFKENDSQTVKLIEEWKKFYPIDNLSNKENNGEGGLPLAVEVIVGGVKMKYPTCYVLITELDDPVNNTLQGLYNGVIPNPISSLHNMMTNYTNYRQTSGKLAERVWQDSTLLLGSNHNFSPTFNLPRGPSVSDSSIDANSQSLDLMGQWDFTDPLAKINCSCVRCKKKPYGHMKSLTTMNNNSQSSGMPVSNSLGSSFPCKVKGDKTDRAEKNLRKGGTPFHRRSPVSVELSTPLLMDSEIPPPLRFSGDPPTPGGTSGPPSCPPSFMYKGSGVGTPSSGLPNLRSNINDANHSVGSPSSIGPSPLPTPLSQPESNMPKLSPHTQTDQCSLSYSIGPSTPLESQVKTPKAPCTPDSQPPKSIPSSVNQVHSPFMSSYFMESQAGLHDITKCSNLQSYNSSCYNIRGLKRPLLPAKDYDHLLDDNHSDSLYDFQVLNAWINHPVKKFKYCDLKNEVIKIVKQGSKEIAFPKIENIGAAKEIDGSRLDDDLALLPGQDLEQMMSGQRSDPYAFVDDVDAETDLEMALKDENGKDSLTVSSPAKPGDLFTSEGLEPSFKDLENIFENSDDNHSDGEGVSDCLFQVPTPPGSNKSSGMPDDTSTFMKTSKTNCGTTYSSTFGSTMIGMVELSKMFPTPPSHEHNPMPSPCPQPESLLGDANDGVCTTNIRDKEIKVDIHPSPNSRSKDLPCVMKPPVIWEFLSSPKYAPLTVLPSQQLPPVSDTPVYRPSIQYALPLVEKVNTSGHMNTMMNAIPTQSIMHRPGWSPISPATSGHYPDPASHRSGPGSAGPASAGPLAYDLSSPASNASSYMNKNLNSVENPPSGAMSQTPQSHSLLVNVILTDSMLNLFKDHNFDSASLCVCTSMGSLKGADGSLYLSDLMKEEDDSVKCSCGFSAVNNRRLAYQSGLFYEDEVDITGIRNDSDESRKESLLVLLPRLNTDQASIEKDSAIIDEVPPSIMEIIKVQCQTLTNACTLLYRASHLYYSTIMVDRTMNVLEFMNGNFVTANAIEQGKLFCNSVANNRSDDSTPKGTCLHKWPYLHARGPNSTYDILRVMKMVQPVLQEAVQKQKSPGIWDAFKVTGPLTWRQFHRLAGRDVNLASRTDDQCEPQPIPTLFVGHDKDWLSLSPFAIGFWDRLLLEPYSSMRDIAYIVVAPDNEPVLSKIRIFFKELSSTYQLCRLGRHTPITKVLRDGIMRVGKTAAHKLAQEPVDEWFNVLGDSPLAVKLRLYAQVCRHHLGPHLSTLHIDSTLLEPNSNSAGIVRLPEKPLPSPMPPPATPESIGAGDRGPTTPKPEQEEIPTTNRDQGQAHPTVDSNEDEESRPPAIVVYIVDPFTYGSEHPELHRLVTIGLLRCYSQLLKSLPEHVQNNLKLQVISLETILAITKESEHVNHQAHLKNLAFSVFSQCRNTLSHSSNVKSLTGFGPAAAADLFLRSKDERNRSPYNIYSPPYILAPLKNKNTKFEDTLNNPEERSTVLYCSYCLSEDQKWLLASCTDNRGEILENCTVNIEIPNRSRRKKASARKIGLQKIMDFFLSVMSCGAVPWRLVICRLGRIGHGELKGWSSLLSKKSLLRASKYLKEICKQCTYLYPNDVPCILSACLVSMEPDSALRMMADQFTPDERFGQNSANCSLSTPEDTSCTHILVFPTSATTQSSQATFQQEHINPLPLESEIGNDFLSDLDLNGELGGDGIDGMPGIDIFSLIGMDAGQGIQSPTESPKRESGSHPCSPGMGPVGGDQNTGPNRIGGAESVEEVAQLLQQPLALGFYVSTAPTGPMPRWFWSSCPHLEHVCPAFLKSALHIHSPAVQQQQDDLLQQSQVKVHPLDSQYTTDVLRYVLEGFNALSWLAIDHTRNDRRSCLPVHIQLLLQTYHAMAAIL